MDTKYILITGNPVQGFQYTGPFNDPEEAGNYALTSGTEADWWVAPLEDAR
jgi:hypothetical protein